MSQITLDVFDGDAFSAATMTERVNENIPFQPSFLMSLALFTGIGVFTDKVVFDELNGALSLIPTSPRGSAPSTSQNAKGKSRIAQTVRIAREAVIYADEIRNVRQLGSANALQTLERLVFNRVEGPLGLKANVGYTLEHMYLGAIDGQVYDADNSSLLFDWFTFYNVARQTEVDIDFSAGAMPADGAVFLQYCMDLKRTMVKELNGFPLNGAFPVALCDSAFYDAAWTNKEVVAARKTGATGNSNAPGIIADNRAFSSFEYGGINWVDYRGSDDSAVSVPAGKARLFMGNVPGLFNTYFAPSDIFDDQIGPGTEGQPSYMLQRPERQTSSARAFEVQSNPLPMCMRPRSLVRLGKV